MLHKDLNAIADYLEAAHKVGAIHTTAIAALAVNVRAVARQAAVLMQQPIAAEIRQPAATNIVTFPERSSAAIPAARA